MFKRILAPTALVLLSATICGAAHFTDRYELRVPGTQIVSEAWFDGNDLVVSNANSTNRYRRAPGHDGNGYRGYENYRLNRIIRWPVSGRGHFEIGTPMPYGVTVFRRSNMVITPLRQLPDFRSKESHVAVELELHNNRRVEVDYYWVNFQGEEEYFGTLQPHETTSLTSYATHPWVFKVRGREIATHVCKTRWHQHVDIDPPPAPIPAPRLTAQDLVGTYVHFPLDNDYHVGNLEIVSQHQGLVVMRWTNRANVSWLLTADLDRGLLHAEPSSPYFKSNPINGRTFEIVTTELPSGKLKIEGFRFLSEIYRRI